MPKPSTPFGLSTTRGFGLDLRILGLTIKKVLFREGISAVGDATMPEFKGSQTKA